MKCLACCYGPLCPCTTIARAWFILPAVRRFHFWWVFDSVRLPFVMIVFIIFMHRICSYSQVVEGLPLGGLRISSLLLWTMWFCRLGDLQLVLKRFTGWDPMFYSFGSSICSFSPVSLSSVTATNTSDTVPVKTTCPPIMIPAVHPEIIQILFFATWNDLKTLYKK